MQTLPNFSTSENSIHDAAMLFCCTRHCPFGTGKSQRIVFIRNKFIFADYFRILFATTSSNRYIRVQLLTSSGVVSSYLACSRSFKNNFQNYIRRRNRMIKEFLDNGEEVALFRSRPPKEFFDKNSIFDLFFFFINRLTDVWCRVLKRKRKSVRWGIRVKSDVAAAESVIILKSSSFNLADPFAFESESDGKGIFFEFWEPEKLGQIAWIPLGVSTDLMRPEIVLTEDFHLSFPFVFHFEGRLLMLPQTDTEKTLIFYENFGSPLKWKEFKRIQVPENLVDCICFFHNGFWWLIGSGKDLDIAGRSNRLLAYYSPNLFSEDLKPHSKNPLVWSDFHGRNGGFIFKNESELFRVSQSRGTNSYGYSYSKHKLVSISPTQFEENLSLNGEIEIVFSSHHFSKLSPHFEVSDFSY